MLGFVFLGDTQTQIAIDKRILTAILTTVLSFFCILAFFAIHEKGLKFKLGFEEFLSIAIIVSLIGVGVCNLLSPLVWRAVSVVIILICCYLFKSGTTTLISSVLGISLAIYQNDISFVSILLVWAVTVESLMPISRYLSALSILLADYIIQLVFSIYSVYSTAEFLSLVFGITFFCTLPTKPLKALKEKLYSFREKHLVRQTINRSRLMLSGRLYDLSSVFTEMATAFTSFNNFDLSPDTAKKTMQGQIVESACRECEFFARCFSNKPKIEHSIGKLLDIGFAKGKVNLIDLPKDMSCICLRPNNIIFTINKQLASFRAFSLEKDNVKTGRNLLASEALGISQILRGLALESGSLLKFQNRTERALSENLFQNGFSINELLIYGEEDRVSVGLIVVMQKFSIEKITEIISKTLGFQMILFERVEITDGKCYLSFKKAADYDAVFGIASAKKDGSTISGDTHAISRIADDRFLLALSDGMGSGKKAEAVSSASLSLIESFYKAGLSSQLILNTVNKLLAINSEDTFTALDVSVIDLKNCTADFIKYGAPYGFIVGDNGVKIVESNTLPLGILDELKPSVCNTTLCDGDVVVLITDGISDAFGSSSEIIDYLRSVPAKNPQTLADGLLSRAIEINSGEKKDDMTALAVRVYKRAC